MDDKTYIDIGWCPVTGEKIVTFRRTSSAGRKVRTPCVHCLKSHMIVAGPVPAKKDKSHG